MRADLALDALEHGALAARHATATTSPGWCTTPTAACQYPSIRYTERLAEAGARPSVGSVGDSYDNAAAESIIGLFKTELIRRRGPWRGLDDVETRHPGMGRLVQQPPATRAPRNIPPAEHEPLLPSQPRPQRPCRWQNRASTKPGAVQSSRACSSAMVLGWSGWARSHFFIVCWNRSALPQVVGWPGREFFWTMWQR